MWSTHRETSLAHSPEGAGGDVQGACRSGAPLCRIVGLCLVMAAASADATMICRWVDDSGRTQLADIVPERYAQSAHCTDSKSFELSPESAQQAQERARRLRQQADIAKKTPGRSAPPEAAAPRASAPAAVKRPAQGVDESTDCATWRRLFEESSACFAPYRTVGGIKAEAFEKCRVIVAPDLKCGPVIN